MEQMPARSADSAALWLPHVYPFLLLDRVLMVEPGQWAVAVKNVSRGDALVDAIGAVPGALLAEMMAQTAGLTLAAEQQPRPAVWLVQIDRFRCRLPIRAGAQLLVSAHVLRAFGRTVKVRTSISADSRWCAAGEVVLHFPTAGAPG